MRICKQGKAPYIPNCQFVLDRYHKNKAIKQALSGIDRLAGSQYEFHIRKALDEGSRDQLVSIRDTLLSRYPDREKTIRENTDYLLSNFDAITITKRDEASLNGGCTEPHVSHVLSARLNSVLWDGAKKTLQRLDPYPQQQVQPPSSASKSRTYRYQRRHRLPETSEKRTTLCQPR